MKKIYKYLTFNEISQFARIKKQSKRFFSSLYTIKTHLYYIYIIINLLFYYNYNSILFFRDLLNILFLCLRKGPNLLKINYFYIILA